MTTFNQLPLTYDGVRLDTLGYAIETLDGRRQLPRARGRDVVVPGLHGEVPSKYDDYEAGRIFLKMWVRSRDVNGVRPANVHPKKVLSDNLDRLFNLFGSKWRFGDLRQQVDMDATDRTSLILNPRLDQSAGTTPFRTNRITNPSFESSSTSVTVRTNMIRNPSFETGVLRWAAESGCTISQASGSFNAAGSNLCQMTSDGSGNVGIVSDSAAAVAGNVYTASAYVGTLEVDPGTHMQILIRWLQPDGITTISESFSEEPVEVTAIEKLTVNVPVPVRLNVSAAAPAGVGFAKVVIRVQEPNQPVNDIYYADAVLLEASATPGDYFDGSYTDLNASWTGVAHDSTSVIQETTTPSWGVPATARLLRVPTEAAFGEYSGEWESLDTIVEGTAVLWQSGTLPASSTGTQWAGSIYIRTDMEEPPPFILKIAFLDAGSNLVGYGRVGSSTGPDASATMLPDGRWWRYAIHRTFVPAGATQARLQVLAGADMAGGVIVQFDGATLEAVAATPFYFDGDTDDAGTEFVWQGVANASYSEWRLGAVANWAATNGSLVHDTAATSYPVRSARACGKFTVSAAAPAFIDSADAIPNTLGQTWTAGAWIWGNAGAEQARIVIELRNGVTPVGSATGSLVTTTGNWTWVPGPEIVQSVGDRLRMRIEFRGAGNVNPSPSAFARICGAVLTTGPAANLSYFDSTTPGAIPGGGNRARRPPQVRQAIVKTNDAISPETRILASGDYVADLVVDLKIPATFWQDVYQLSWTSLTQSSAQTRTYEITNLQDTTAPLEDLVFVVFGGGSNPRITDPQSGAWVQLNSTVPAGQAWRFDAGRWLSGRGAATLSPNSSVWSDVLSITSSTGPRARFALHPEWDEEAGIHIVRVQLKGATKVQVFGRRKYL